MGLPMVSRQFGGIRRPMLTMRVTVAPAKELVKIRHGDTNRPNGRSDYPEQP